MFYSFEKLHEICGFDSARFLIFSGNVFEPIIYYSHFVGFFATLILALFIWLRGSKSPARTILLSICFFICLWIFSNLVLWATDRPELSFFFWSLTNLAEPCIYVMSLLLLDAMRGKNFLTKTRALLYATPILPVALFLWSPLMLEYYDASNCDRNLVEGPLSVYIVGLNIVFLVLILTKTILSRKNGAALLTGIAVTAMLIIFSFWNSYIALVNNFNIEGYNLFGIPIFVAVLAYAIIKYKAFDTRVFATQALALGVWFLVFSLLFVGDIAIRKIIISATLAATGVAGYYLVKSVSREVALRERAEGLSKNLEIANLRLLELDKQKTEFVSLASHQLRGPLTAIKGYASMLNEGDYGALPVSAMEILGRIQKSAHDMAVLITDYLDVTRIELGKVKYQPERFSMRDLVAEVEKELAPNVHPNVTLTIDEGTDPRFVYADRNKVKQVVANLIDNAVKYTPQGAVTAAVTRVDGYARLEVKDNGVGISKASLPHLFQKFSRAQNASKSNIKGTGLGLYIAKTIADHHRGRLSVFSEGEGKGSTFTFDLPLSDEQAPSAKA